MASYFDNYKTIIGLECHIQLKTKSKLFSPALNKFGCIPNSNTDVIDFAMPGVLPVLNQEVINFAISLGHALKCTIKNKSIFSRKHYFYPDLPKGYQISQFDKPICKNGTLKIETYKKYKFIDITRIHIEEDAGKNIHNENENSSYIDLNRAGTPLLEVVTEPQINSSEEAISFVKTLRSIVTYLEICDGNMEEGSLRTDMNISICKKKSNKLGTRIEIKNLNSTKFLAQAINFEVNRQIIKLESNKKIVQETRLWDPSLKESKTMRSKEEAHDYRYFPDPDLLPLIIDNTTINQIKKKLPELPNQKFDRFKNKLCLSKYNASILTQEKQIADYFEKTLSYHNNPKSIANWIVNEILHEMKSNINNKINLKKFPIKPYLLAELIKLIDTNEITGTMAKAIFKELVKNQEKSLKKIIQENGFKLEKNINTLTTIISLIVSENQNEKRKYQAGKKQLFGFFMGEIMKKTKKNADPKKAAIILKKILN